MRIFIAILLKQNIINQLVNIKHQAFDLAVEGKYTSDTNFHITLHYIGECDELMTKRIRSAMNLIDCESFKTYGLSLNLFKRHKKKKVLYLGVEKNSSLLDCHHQVVSQLKQIGIEINTCEYTPHITIGRQVVIDDQMVDQLEVSKLEIQVDCIHVMESKRVDNHLVYESIYKVKLT